MKIILASKSPRRKELLGELFRDFTVITKDVDETLTESVHPKVGVEILAIRKGEAVAAENPYDMVISSDTLVEIDGVALGKPRDRSEAERMLRRLSGCTHNVHTGVAVHYNGHVYSGVDTTEVSFRRLDDSEIGEYIDTGEPMDKAGAYGIQGLGGNFVVSYKGNYDTVVGISLALTKKLFEKAVRECEAKEVGYD